MASPAPGSPLFRQIVVGCDDDAGTTDALRLGVELAELDADTTLTLVHAHAPAANRFGRRGRSEEYDESLHGAGMELLERLRDGLPGDLHERIELLSLPVSSPSYALHDVARGSDTDLIVVGPADHGPLGRLLLGSSSRGVVHGAPCPVAVPPRIDGHAHSADATREIGAIGVGYDGSAVAEEAVDFAARLAQLSDRALDVIVAADLDSAGDPDLTALVPEPTPAEQLQTQARELVEECIAGLDDGVRARAVVIDAEPIEALVAHSGELHLLVVGSRDYGPLRHVLLGSVSRGVLDRAACPVLVVPRTREDGES